MEKGNEKGERGRGGQRLGFELQSRLLMTQEHFLYFRGHDNVTGGSGKAAGQDLPSLFYKDNHQRKQKEVKAAEGKMEGGGVGAPFCGTAASRGASRTT